MATKPEDKDGLFKGADIKPDSQSNASDFEQLFEVINKTPGADNKPSESKAILEEDDKETNELMAENEKADEELVAEDELINEKLDEENREMNISAAEKALSADEAEIEAEAESEMEAAEQDAVEEEAAEEEAASAEAEDTPQSTSENEAEKEEEQKLEEDKKADAKAPVSAAQSKPQANKPPEKVLNSVEKATKSFKDTISKNVTAGLDANSNEKAAGEAFAALMENLLELLKLLFTAAKHPGQAYNGVSNAITTSMQKSYDGFKEDVGNLYGGAKKLTQAVAHPLDTGEKAVNKLTSSISAIGDTTDKTSKQISDDLSKATNTFKDDMKEVGGFFKDKANTVADKLDSLAQIARSPLETLGLKSPKPEKPKDPAAKSEVNNEEAPPLDKEKGEKSAQKDLKMDIGATEEIMSAEVAETEASEAIETAEQNAAVAIDGEQNAAEKEETISAELENTPAQAPVAVAPTLDKKAENKPKDLEPTPKVSNEAAPALNKGGNEKLAEENPKLSTFEKSMSAEGLAQINKMIEAARQRDPVADDNNNKEKDDEWGDKATVSNNSEDTPQQAPANEDEGLYKFKEKPEESESSEANEEWTANAALPKDLQEHLKENLDKRWGEAHGTLPASTEEEREKLLEGGEEEEEDAPKKPLNAVQKATQRFKDTISKNATAGLDADSNEKAAGEAFAALLEDLLELLRLLFAAAKHPGQAYNEVSDAVTTSMQKSYDGFKEDVGNLYGGAKKLTQAVAHPLDTGEKAVNKLTSSIGAIGDTSGKASQQISDDLSKATNTFKDDMKEVGGFFKDKANTVADKLDSLAQIARSPMETLGLKSPKPEKPKSPEFKPGSIDTGAAGVEKGKDERKNLFAAHRLAENKPKPAPNNEASLTLDKGAESLLKTTSNLMNALALESKNGFANRPKEKDSQIIAALDLAGQSVTKAHEMTQQSQLAQFNPNANAFKMDKLGDVANQATELGGNALTTQASKQISEATGKDKHALLDELKPEPKSKPSIPKPTDIASGPSMSEGKKEKEKSKNRSV